MFERRYIFQGPSFLAFMLDFGGVQTPYNAKNHAQMPGQCNCIDQRGGGSLIGKDGAGLKLPSIL